MLPMDPSHLPSDSAGVDAKAIAAKKAAFVEAKSTFAAKSAVKVAAKVSGAGDHPPVEKVAAKAATQSDSPDPKPSKVDPAQVAKIKAAMQSEIDSGDTPGVDANKDGMYDGKSLELGAGGRAKLLADKITLELVQQGYTYDDARALAAKRVWVHGVETYGEDKMKAWATKGK